jgi:hypothetical protein
LPQAPLDAAQRLACLRLIRSDNVGPVTFRELINHFGGAEPALAALPELSRRGGRQSIRVCPESQAAAELGLPGQVDLADHFGIDIAIAVADETPFPSACRVLRDDGDTRVAVVGSGRTVQTRAGAWFYRELEVAIGSRADLERLRFESPALDSRYGGFLRQVASQRDRRCVFVKTGGPFLRTAFLRGKAAFLEDIAADPGFARAQADRVADHIAQVGLESLARGDLWENGLWIYDDMAYNDGPLFSPASFERIFLPAYRRIVAAFKGAGCRRVVLHSDGDIRPLLDMLVDAGIDGINPVEPRWCRPRGARRRSGTPPSARSSGPRPRPLPPGLLS